MVSIIMQIILHAYLLIKIIHCIDPPCLVKSGRQEGGVVDPGKGVCADPVNRDAILGKGGTGPGGGDKRRQFSLDRGGDKT
jgi:hypothetical protein